tara:strand:- start:216 stop:1106 length:891 start_codon:yes stop_codon:yes gene_type:complete
MNIAVIGDSNSLITDILLKALIKVIKENKDFKLVAIIDANKLPAIKSSPIRSFLKYAVKKFFNPFDKNVFYYNPKPFLYKYRKKFSIIKPDGINNPLLLSKVKNMKLDLTFSLACPQILKEKTILTFGRIVNYHDSLLPKYGGVHATPWSLFFEEKYTGYTYHFINNQIDEGNIIYQNKVEANYNKNTYHNIIVKTNNASRKIGHVLQLCSDNFEGTPQNLEEKLYFSKKDFNSISNVDNTIEKNKIIRVINAFGKAYIPYGKYGSVPVTKFGDKIERINYLPLLVFKCIKKIIPE